MKVNELVKVDVNTQTVSARDLYERLNIGTRFNDWFPRMVEYGFEEGIDFYSKVSKTSTSGGRPAMDADISMDMAKEICMIQRTPEGKAIRRYLIDLEKVWNTPELVMERAVELQKRKPKVMSLGEVVNLMIVTRTTMKEQGSTPREVAAALKNIADEHGIQLPEHFVRPEKTTMKDVHNMVDFIYSHSADKKKPSFEDYVVHQISIKKLNG